MTRQRALARQDGPQLWAIVDEAAIRRVVGGPAVMRTQLDHLAQASEEHNMTLGPPVLTL